MCRKSINICDVSETADHRNRARSHSGAVRNIAYCAKAKTIASVADDGTLQIWDADTGVPCGEPLSVCDPHENPCLLAISRSGNKVAFCTSDGICAWNVAKRAEIGKIRFSIVDCTNFSDIGISDDGKRVFLDSRSFYGRLIWQTSSSVLTEIDWYEVPPSLDHAWNSMEKQAKEGKLIVCDAEQLPRSMKPLSASVY